MINLYEAEVLSDGTKRLQSQLYIGRDSADFILDTDGILKNWNNGNKGFGFYEYKGEYKIHPNPLNKK